MADYASINTTQADSFIPELWATEALTALRSYLNLTRTIRRDFDTTVARYGDTIHIPKTGALSVNTKTTNTNVTKQAPADDQVDVVLNQWKEVTFLVEDPARAMANQDLRGLYIRDAVIALAESVESALTAQHANAGSDITFDETSDATVITSMLNIRKAFVDAKVPILEPKYLYACPSVINYLLKTSNFTKVSEYGSARPVVEGQVGDIFGINVFESQLVATSGSPTNYHNLAYTRDALVLATRPLPTDGDGMGVSQSVVSDPESGLSLRITSSYDANALGVQVTLDILYGIKALRDEFLFDVNYA